MKKTLLIPAVVVKESTIQGYGIFATRPILSGEIIEECHALVFNNMVEELTNYLFSWRQDPFQTALPLGYGSIYNHSSSPNAKWTRDFDKQIITFKAVRNIAPGEEITTTYTENWFAARNIKKMEPEDRVRQTLKTIGKILTIIFIIIALKNLL